MHYYSYLIQLEREQEEHLRPRLQLQEVERAPSEASDQPVKAKEESSSSSSEEDEKPPVKPKLPPAPPKPVVESAPSLQSVSETNTPFTDDDTSRLSAPGQFMDESSPSQPGFGPALKDEGSKMGFGSLKIGEASVVDWWMSDSWNHYTVFCVCIYWSVWIYAEQCSSLVLDRSHVFVFFH